MTNKIKYLLKNIGILTIGNFSSKILVFLLVPLYTNILSTEEYGIYDLVFTTIQLLFPILTANISAGILRFVMDKSMPNEIVVKLAIRCLGISIVISGLGVLFLHYFTAASNNLSKINGFEIIILLYYIMYACNQCLIAYAKGLERISDVAIAGVLSSIAMLTFNILFLLVFRIGLKGFFIANLIAFAIPVIFYLIRLPFFDNGPEDRSCNLSDKNDSFSEYKKEWKNLNNKGNRQILRFTIPLIIVELGWWVNNAADKYTVALICGTAATGLLSVSYKIPSVINVIQQIFIQAWHVSGIKEYEENGDNEFYRKIFTYLSMVMSFSCIILIAFAPFLGKLLFAKDFSIAWKYTPFLLISSVINASSGYIGAILSAKKDSKSMALSGFAGAISNIFLNFLLVWIMGIQGATIATMISSILIFFVRWVGTKDILYWNTIRNTIISWTILSIQSVMSINGWWLVQLFTVIIGVSIYKQPIFELLDKKEIAIRKYRDKR